MRRAAAQRGWPEPDLYADLPGGDTPGPALRELTAAVAAGRHDGVLVSLGRACDTGTRQLLAACTANGVTVSFIPVPRGFRQPRPRRRGDAPGSIAGGSADALGQAFPAWRIWHDDRGWHARRRDSHLQLLQPGAPVFYVRADDAAGLAAQLCWQAAADDCAARGAGAQNGAAPAPHWWLRITC